MSREARKRSNQSLRRQVIPGSTRVVNISYHREFCPGGLGMLVQCGALAPASALSSPWPHWENWGQCARHPLRGFTGHTTRTRSTHRVRARPVWPVSMAVPLAWDIGVFCSSAELFLGSFRSKRVTTMGLALGIPRPKIAFCRKRLSLK